MGATAPRPKRPARPKRRRPRREYVVVDQPPEDEEAGNAVAEAWLSEPEKR